MASENPDDKDGSKNSGEKKYKGVKKTKYDKFVARCGSGANRHIGTFDTAADAARAYDERARDLLGAQADLNFPDFHTDDNSSLATESTLPIATPSVRGVQGVPSGRSSANAKNKGEKIKHIIISDSDVDAAGPCEKEARNIRGAKATHNSPHLRTEDDLLPAMKSALPTKTSSVKSVASRSEFPNIPSEQEALNNFEEYLNHFLSDEEGSKSALPTATSSVKNVASRSEFPNIPSEQEVLNNFEEYLNHFLSDEEGSKSALPTETSSVWAEVGTRGSRIGSTGSTTVAVAEPHAAAEEVILPTATNNTLPIAESSVTGVASRPESANISSEQEELNNYAEYLNNLFSDEEGSKSS